MTRTEREELLSYINDAHKDAFGFRPRGNWDKYLQMSIEELRGEADYLTNQVALEIERENLERANNAQKFESYISSLMFDHNIDRNTAIRWDIEAHNIVEEINIYGMSALAHQYGLRYNYFD